VRFTLPHESTDEFEVPDEIIGSSSFSEQYSSMFRKEYDAISHEALQESILLSEDHVPDFGVMSMEGSNFHANSINDDTPDETLCIDEKFSEESVEVTPNNELTNESLILQDNQSVGANDNERLLVQTLIQPDEKSLAHDENNDFDPGLPLEQFKFFDAFQSPPSIMHKSCSETIENAPMVYQDERDSFHAENIENKYNASSLSKPGMKWDKIHHRLQYYKQQYSNCLVPCQYVGDKPLAAWITTELTTNLTIYLFFHMAMLVNPIFFWLAFIWDMFLVRDSVLVRTQFLFWVRTYALGRVKYLDLGLGLGIGLDTVYISDSNLSI
jgi:hypothetical protein